MATSGSFRRIASLVLAVVAMSVPAAGAAQEPSRSPADTIQSGDPRASAIPLDPEASVIREIPAPDPAPATRGPWLSPTGRAGLYLGMALGAQIGAVRGLRECHTRRDGDCHQNQLALELAFTVGSGALGAAIGTLVHRRRAPTPSLRPSP